MVEYKRPLGPESELKRYSYLAKFGKTDQQREYAWRRLQQIKHKQRRSFGATLDSLVTEVEQFSDVPNPEKVLSGHKRATKVINRRLRW